MDRSTTRNESDGDQEFLISDHARRQYYQFVELKIRKCSEQIAREGALQLEAESTVRVSDIEGWCYEDLLSKLSPALRDVLVAAARSVRQALVDHVRSISVVSASIESGIALDVLAEQFERHLRFNIASVDDALTTLARSGSFYATLLELRLFLGLTIPQITDLLATPAESVTGDIRFAVVRLTEHLLRSDERLVEFDWQRTEDLPATEEAIQANIDRFRCPFAIEKRLLSERTTEEGRSDESGSSDESVACGTTQTPRDPYSTVDYPPSAGQRDSDLPDRDVSPRLAPLEQNHVTEWGLPSIPGFEILQEIGRGGMGVVYRAIDQRNGEVVALKTMLRADSSMLARFKKEFRSLSSLLHPNLVKLYELSFHMGMPYFTMEYVAGRDFRSYVREELKRDEPLSEGQWTRLHSALIQLAAGVGALHAASKVHRDLKHSNILITSSGRLVILDFGLAIELRPDGTYETVNRYISGTPAFMSPEQRVAGMVTPASDWYSVGVVIHDAIFGRLPGRLDSEAVSVSVPMLSLGLTGIARDIATLCHDLLQLDPDRRPDVGEVLRRLGNRAAAPLPITRHSFVGRESQLQRLWQSFETLRTNRPVTVLVSGQSGAGKSALIREFVESVRNEPGCLVLSGRCYKQETVPYKAVDELVDSLGRFLCSLTHEQCDALLPRDTAALVKVFPTLQQVDAARRAPLRELSSFDQQELRQRAFAALRELLTRLGDRKQLVLIIDDLQWGDADSTALLNCVLQQPDGPTALFVGSFRSEDLDSNKSLTSLVAGLCDAEHVSLDALSQQQSYQLALNLLRTWGITDGHDEMARRIASESLGNPFFLRELATSVVQGVSETSAGRRHTLEELLWSRIRQIPAPMQSLLFTLAIAGQPLQQEFASTAANLEISNLSEVLKVLRDEHLIRDCGNPEENRIDTYHDRVREIIFTKLNMDSQQQLHRRLAEAGEGRSLGDPKFLALHFRMADEPEKAARYYLLAGDRDAEILAFNQAVSNYSHALQLHTFSNSEQLRVRIKMAAALSSDCRSLEAAQEYLALSEMEGANRLEMLRQAFTQYISIGRLSDGLSILESALEMLGLKLPQSPRSALVAMLLARARLWFRGTAIRLRDRNDISPDDLLRVDVLWSVAICLTTIDHIRAENFVARACLEAVRVGEAGRIAICMATEAGHLACPGRATVGRSEKLMKRAKSVLTEADNPINFSIVRLCEGVQAGLLGNWNSCYIYSTEAEQGSVANEFFHCVTARFWRNLSLVWLGRLAQLQEDCPKIMGSAEARGDLFELVSTGAFPMSMARLAQNKPDVAWIELNHVMDNWTHDGFHVQHHLGIVARASILLYQGRLREAEDVLSQSWRVHKQSLLMFTQLVRVNLQYLRVRIALQSIGQSSPFSNPAGVARKTLRSLMRERRPWTTALAIAGHGSLAAKLGDFSLAKTHLSKAATSFAALGMELHEAAASRHLGQLEQGPYGRAKIEAADAWMIQQQRVVSPERMAEFLIPGAGSPTQQP